MEIPYYLSTSGSFDLHRVHIRGLIFNNSLHRKVGICEAHTFCQTISSSCGNDSEGYERVLEIILCHVLLTTRKDSYQICQTFSSSSLYQSHISRRFLAAKWIPCHRLTQKLPRNTGQYLEYGQPPWRDLHWLFPGHHKVHWLVVSCCWSFTNLCPTRAAQFSA